ncbi:hypothetical protein SDRG_04560 [Saprolegnia diclina VS20]|uniref:Uncharacterized protein n=1 Tax=Saprolegnia diclina (strain VS20) TaxID=1156394 RepID=T0QVS2_SAPDV|nr:hypothetical protein SDRG_04560 [Saprolegnia diclina VS20]EQC38130.1 hypothetical protein SDRG_04560 [Saprolegnia diclina VS20]|eukprot:XP_008608457.1 hypothetical protein SDRG_04560 [Saprolegnia diclina VS20]
MRSRAAPMYEPAVRTGHLPSRRVFHGSRDVILDPTRSIELLSLGSAGTGEINQVEFLYLPSGEILAQTPTKPSSSPPPMAASTATSHVPMLLESVDRYDQARSPSSSYASTLRPQQLSPRSASAKSYSSRASHLKTPYQQRILELETLLEHEKKRSLQKMRQLLDEQDKTRELESQVSALQNRCHVLEGALERQDAHARELQEANETYGARMASLLADHGRQTSQMEALQHQIQTLAATSQAAAPALELPAVTAPPPPRRLTDQASQTEPETPPNSEQPPSSSHHLALLEAIGAWKQSLDEWCAQPPSPLKVRLEDLLQDFPSLLLPASSLSIAPVPFEASAVLKRQLQLMEREWRQTHAKYVELKELCARQCVREADLQNFVNEHRLRGNCSLQAPSTAAASTFDDTLHGDQGRMKVVITHKAESAVHAKLDALRVRKEQVTVLPSARLAKKHERISTPKALKKPKKQHRTEKAPSTAGRTPLSRPWVC